MSNRKLSPVTIILGVLLLGMIVWKFYPLLSGGSSELIPYDDEREAVRRCVARASWSVVPSADGVYFPDAKFVRVVNGASLPMVVNFFPWREYTADQALSQEEWIIEGSPPDTHALPGEAVVICLSEPSLFRGGAFLSAYLQTDEKTKLMVVEEETYTKYKDVWHQRIRPEELEAQRVLTIEIKPES